MARSSASQSSWLSLRVLPRGRFRFKGGFTAQSGFLIAGPGKNTLVQTHWYKVAFPKDLRKLFTLIPDKPSCFEATLYQTHFSCIQFTIPSLLNSPNTAFSAPRGAAMVFLSGEKAPRSCKISISGQELFYCGRINNTRHSTNSGSGRGGRIQVSGVPAVKSPIPIGI